MRGLDQDHSARIETEGAQSVAMRTAVIPQSIGRHNEEKRVTQGQARQQRHNETEGGGTGTCFGHNLMQSATGETALRQASINGGKAERDGFGSPKPLHLRQ